ncbi:sensor domain-containing diguanylate cyclase [Pseudomonas gingeri]|uniref:diguanylate cyclase n=1 Tax=Pseudomonas gingeri TaxID=117681 RepID=A0A7Y7YH02_9PSED|nr:sensor domain-containing diguanylate cyclase [Pseudomonas gingeri]NWB30533.1 diguanylate cyclase [Pseudomonas gingeri]NWC35611.1 diguanylate cyclase [Pseudomonas gingeri]NWD08978.1 diguanylate cyclase [Pseudomonas gingeri]NWE34809.1 diguanylate cyclase [Pseudomonas gingeri]NWE56910.1 diguanylate cyclase [Pseudomonas gingeri]
MANAPRNGPWNINLSDIGEDVVHAILELISDGIWDWNANTGFVYRNPGWYEMLGYAPHALPNTVFTWENLVHPDDYPQVMTHFDNHLHGHTQGYQAEYRLKNREGDYILIEDRGYVIARNDDGSVARMIGAHRSIEDKRRLLEQFEVRTHSLEALVSERTAELSRVNHQLQLQLEENRKLAHSDSLTGVANRYRLEQVLRKECERAQRFRQPLSLIAMDIDDFKLINDRHGHLGGDAVLIEVAECIQACLRDVDVLARWGGDEFIVVVPHGTRATSTTLAGRIRRMILKLRPRGTISLSMSFGVVERLDGEQMAALMGRADQALYRSKAAGKNMISD